MDLGMTRMQTFFVKLALERYLYRYKFYYYGDRVKESYDPNATLLIMVKGPAKLAVPVEEAMKKSFEHISLPFPVRYTDYYDFDEETIKKLEKEFVPVFSEEEIESSKVPTIIGLEPRMIPLRHYR